MLLAFAGTAHGAQLQSYGFSDTVWGNPDITQQTALDAFSGAHASYVRTPVNWQYYEPTQGNYSASYLVWLYQEYQAMLANGQTPIFNLLGTPYWALTALGRGAGTMSSLCADNNNATQCFAPPDVRDDTIREHWKMFAATLAFIMPKATFEIWNEPNISWFWLQPQDPELYGLMLKSASEGVRMGSATATVVSASLASYNGPNTAMDTNFPTFLSKMYPASGTASFDALGFHTYPCNQVATKAGWIKQPAADLALLRKSRDANGDQSKPVWITETGATTGGNSDANCGTHFTDAQQSGALGAVLDWAKSENNAKADLPVVLAYSAFNNAARAKLTVASTNGQAEFGLKAWAKDASTGKVTIANKPAWATIVCKFGRTC